jgi:hypothetical protein
MSLYLKSGNLNSTGISAEKVCMSLELLVINYSNKKYEKENTSLVNLVFSEQVDRFMK